MRYNWTYIRPSFLCLFWILVGTLPTSTRASVADLVYTCSPSRSALHEDCGTPGAEKFVQCGITTNRGTARRYAVNPFTAPKSRITHSCSTQIHCSLALITKSSVRTLVRSVEETNGAEVWRQRRNIEKEPQPAAPVVTR